MIIEKSELNRMKIIVHAGFHKTGSTSLQHALAQSQIKGNLPSGVGYFTISYKNELYNNPSTFISCAFGTSGRLSRVAIRKKLSDYKEDDFRLHLEHFSKQNLGCLIISSESISTLSEEGLIKFRNCLESFTSDLDLIGLIRPPYSWLNSSVQQRIKEGLYHDLDNLADIPQYKESIVLKRYQDLLSVFGERAKIYPFSEAVGFEGGLVNYIMSKLDINCQLKNIRTNSSLSNLMTRLQNQINLLTGSEVEKSLRLKQIFQPFEDKSPAFKLTEREFRPIQGFIERMNEEYADILGEDYTDKDINFSDEISADSLLSFSARAMTFALSNRNSD